jgi:hypothetical protein
VEDHGQGARLERRAVGLPTAISTVFGLIVATTVLVSIGQGFAASWIFLVALGIGLLAMYLQALSFSELATMIPKAGSMNEYVRAGLGAFAGSITALMGYVAIVVFPTAAESLFPAIIITEFLGVAGDPKLWVIIIVLAVAALNVFGIRPFAVVEIALTAIVALSVLAFGLIGVLGLGTGDAIGPALPSTEFDWATLTGLLGLAVFAFVGLEYTCPLAEELDDPRRELPLGMFLGLGLIAVPLVLFGMAATRYVPAEQLGDPTALTHMTGGHRPPRRHGQVVDGDRLHRRHRRDAQRAARRHPPPALRHVPHPAGPAGLRLPAALHPRAGGRHRGHGAHPDPHERVRGRLGRDVHRARARRRARLGDGLHPHPHLADHPAAARAGAERPFRSPLFPLPQLLGIGLLLWAAIKIFPDPAVRDNIYRDYLLFLAVSVVAAFLYNLYAMKSVSAQFRPVPLREVMAGTETVREVERREFGADPGGGRP